jgi:hypothetical protein
LQSSHERLALQHEKSMRIDSFKGKENTMISSYQLMINMIADYIEIIMLSIGVIVFLASE